MKIDSENFERSKAQKGTRCWICRRTRPEWNKMLYKDKYTPKEEFWLHKSSRDVGWLTDYVYICPVCYELITDIGIEDVMDYVKENITIKVV